ncbi:MAG: rRNA maturation RNase YbeY [Kiritimatiellae bacterium]|nr:rRNA maturation RNase YbeY [Kiritimatiellia bacterium]MDW8458654.1 rRNA maturation RNase YbeY [Verrucomicrobiota bacterium]
MGIRQKSRVAPTSSPGEEIARDRRTSAARIRISAEGAPAGIQRLALRKLARFFLERAGLKNVLEELSVVLTGDAAIARINEQYLSHSGPTDVITFRLEPPPGAGRPVGEIYLNAELALREANRRNISPNRELAWYLAHGIHHLTGADDETPAARTRMHRVEQLWIHAASRVGLVSPIWNRKGNHEF